MAFETEVIKNIQNKFKETNTDAPNVWFEYGTLWADTNQQSDVYTIRQALEECLNSKYKVKVSKLDATETEPWDQYAFDITLKPFYEDDTFQPEVVS